MKALLAIAVLIVGLAMLGLAAGFAAGAIRRTRAAEAADDESPSPAPPPHPYAAAPAPPESPRGMWAGAGISAALGMGALITAAIALLSVMATPTRVLNTPAQAGGLQRDDSPGTRQLTDRQRERLKAAGMPNPLTAVYHGAAATTTTVLFIGASGRLADPATQLKEFISGLATSTGAGGRALTPYPAGRLKGTVMCIDQLSTGQATLATCGWADEGTLGVITTDAGDAAQTAGLLLSMRDDMEKKA
ncbi:hypothetical protein [Actinoallomurus iriomotensis]|uniref:Uncharacterized protein n=1 Tax=Actinoallomurus iriomotensis TaxID=478107 RepID=A0A9W6VWU1_9ACTN|nr:hypothetical protein [Actinoallomurus iriomotensis]GLY81937.1 hypothetical protein Airi01_102040 [Actinoallomurus iriomotensis]